MACNRNHIRWISEVASFAQVEPEILKLDKDYFQITFVIFVMDHLLAPLMKHFYYYQIDFWGQWPTQRTLHNSIGVTTWLLAASWLCGLHGVCRAPVCGFGVHGKRL
jgi:hypothetical protein